MATEIMPFVVLDSDRFYYYHGSQSMPKSQATCVTPTATSSRLS